MTSIPPNRGQRWLVLAFILLLPGLSLGSPDERRIFGKGHPFTVDELPTGKLKEQLHALDPKARGKAMKWLHRFQFGERDAANSLRADKDGGIFFVCNKGPEGACKGCGNPNHDHGEAAPLDESTEESPATTESAETTESSEPTVESASVSISNPPKYDSKPGAPNVIYLDFNGGIVSGTAWNSTVSSFDTLAWSRDTDRTTFSDSEQVQIRLIWERMAEDFAPFDVNVTTDTAYDPDNYTGDRSRVGWCLFTPSKDRNGVSNPHDGSGGIAYVGVFGQSNYDNYSPAWCQDYGQPNAAEVGSHEIGHNLGLSHDGTSTQEYYGGHAGTTNAPSWGPIMGTGYGRAVSQWSKNTEYYDGNRTQDDFSVISSRIPYRADAHGNDAAGATVLSDATVNLSSVIERSGDFDFFVFNTDTGSISFNATTYKCESSTWGSNLDILLELYDSNLNLLTSVGSNDGDVDAALNYSITTAGEYYLAVKPAGCGNPLNSSPSGYTSYGSVGSYTLAGNFVPTNSLALSSPNGGESWHLENTYDITWSSGMGGDVKIELFKGGVLHTTIAASTPNDGSYSWLVPAGQAVGSDYKVRLTSLLDTSKTDESLSNFSISSEPTIASAVDNTSLTWSTTGNANWFPQTTITHDGVDAAQSGAITHSQTSSVETTLSAAGTLTFWWKVSSESSYDFLRFYLNGVEQTGAASRISGDTAWAQVSVSIPSGTNTVRWSYTKDGSVSGGSDCGWLDEVAFTPDAITYTVAYNGNGNDGGTAPANQNKEQGVDLTLATNSGNLTKSGYSFEGWNTQSDGLGTDYAEGATYTNDADVTLYAKWVALPTYTVSYHGNGNTGGTVPSSQTKYHGQNLTLATNSGNLTKSGFGFSGWNTSADGTGTHYAEEGTFSVDADTTLYAEWNGSPVANAGSDETIYMTGSDAAWTPADATTVAWYDADDSSTITQSSGAVSQWNDKSGNAYHMKQTQATKQPVYTSSDTRFGGRPSISTGPNYKYLQMDQSPAVKRIYLVTYYMDGTQTSWTNHNAVVGSPDGSVRLCGRSGGNNVFDGSRDGKNFDNGGTTYRNGSTVNTNEQPNGLPITGEFFTVTAASAKTAQWRLLGSNASWTLWDGGVGEVIFTDGTESLEVQQKIEGYLAWKWGMEGKLPAAHPYSTSNATSGPMKSVASASTTLAGSATDPENDSISYSWSVVSTSPSGQEGNVSFDNASLAAATATFTAEGTYTLRLTSSDAYSSTTDDVVITVNPPPYDAWKASTFANAFTDTASTSDPDGDGMLNFVEFAFGTDPTTGSSGSMAYTPGGSINSPGMPILEGPDGGYKAVFSRRKDHVAAGLTYAVEFTCDLQAWTADSTGLQVVTGAGSSGDYEAVSVPFPASVPLQAGGSDVPKFFRVKVTYTP
ncbi:MAG: InlB B-repeat-containing protein [Akkermansiaceae bacterium]|nr:InlB B-repeat-containing protein [Akkermansiaceae bacterium]